MAAKTAPTGPTGRSRPRPTRSREAEGPEDDLRLAPEAVEEQRLVRERARQPGVQDAPQAVAASELGAARGAPRKARGDVSRPTKASGGGVCCCCGFFLGGFHCQGVGVFVLLRDGDPIQASRAFQKHSKLSI